MKKPKHIRNYMLKSKIARTAINKKEHVKAFEIWLQADLELEKEKESIYSMVEERVRE